ncbi:MAG: AsmA family protein [Gammaproteobacteria bacterium]
MKTLFKFLVWSLGVLAALVVAAVIALPLLIDPNDYKERIVQLVEAQTGREFSAQGDIKLSVFPWLGFDLGAASLGNAPGFGPQPFATIKRLRVGVALLPLLREKVEMGTVIIYDLSVHLLRSQKGESNWADLVAGGKSRGAASGLRLAALALGGLDIRNASVAWEDQYHGRRYVIKNLNIETGTVRIGEPLDLSLAFQLQDSAAGITGDIALDALLDFRPDHKQYRFRPLDFNARLKGPGFPSGSADIDLKADIAADLKGATARVSDLSLRILGAQITGDGQAIKLTDDPELHGSIRIAPFDLRRLLGQIGQEVPKTADPGVLRSVELSMPFTGSKRGLTLKAIEGKFDDSQIKGDLSITDFADPDIGFSLDLDRFNADRYLPPHAPNAVTPETVAVGVAAEWPSKTLHALKLKGDLRAGHFTLNRIPLTKVTLAVRAHDGRIVLDPVSAQLFGGRYDGNVALDATGTQPLITVDSTLDAVQLGPLLEHVTGGSKIDGRTRAEAKFTASGASTQALNRTLTGDLRFVLRDGVIRGFNIARIIREVESRVSGYAPPPSSEPVQTDFSEMTGTVHLANGLASNKDLVLKSPLLRVEGMGHATLPTEQVDYRINATLVDTLKGQGGKGLKELKGIPIPVRVSGTFDKLKFTPDIQGLIEARAKKELERQKDKVEAKLQEALERKLGDKLGDLLGSKPKQEQQPPPQQNTPSADQGQNPVEDGLKDRLKRALPF